MKIFNILILVLLSLSALAAPGTYWTEAAYKEAKAMVNASKRNGNQIMALYLTNHSEVKYAYTTAVALTSAPADTLSDWCSPCVSMYTEVKRYSANFPIPTIVVNMQHNDDGGIAKEVLTDFPFVAESNKIPRVYILQGTKVLKMFSGGEIKGKEAVDTWAKIQPLGKSGVQLQPSDYIVAASTDFELSPSVMKDLEADKARKAEIYVMKTIWNAANAEKAKEIKKASLADPRQHWFLYVCAANPSEHTFTIPDPAVEIDQKSINERNILLSDKVDENLGITFGYFTNLYEKLPIPTVIVNLYDKDGKVVPETKAAYPFLEKLIPDADGVPVLIALKGNRVSYRFPVDEMQSYQFKEYWCKIHPQGQMPANRSKLGLPPVNITPEAVRADYLKD